MSTPSTTAKLLLLGATGHLGAELLHYLTNEHYAKHFQVTALVRAETLESKDEKKAARVAKLKAAGVHFVTGDVLTADVAEIAKWLAGHEIVVSALANHTPGVSVELKVLEAAKLAKVQWLVPGIFGSDVTKAYTDATPPLATKKKVVEAVQASGLNYFIVLNYGFTEYLINPIFGVDIVNATMTAGNSFADLVSTTSVPDIAHLTVEALLHRDEAHVKNQFLHFVGDTVTFEQVAQILEEHFKKPFKRVLVTKDELLAKVAADTAFKNIPARFGLVFAAQKGVFFEKKDSWNVNHAKHIKVSTVKEFVAGLKQQ